MKHEIKREETVFLFIDIQDTLAKVSSKEEDLKKNANILAETAKIMDIEAICTSQYKKGLGPFNEEIHSKLGRVYDIDKKTFSCMLNQDFKDKLKELNPKSVVVSGIEAHICVLLTVRDLLKAGYEVYVAADAIDSRSPQNVSLALEEMRDMGAVVRPTETILFDLNSVSGTDEFKAVQKLIK